MALTTTQVSQLYVALFGRASEGKGNKNWVNHNKNMIDTAALMLDTDAAKNYFGEAGETNYGFVEVIYKNTLGFDNAADIAAWAANLDNGMSKAKLVTLLLEEALSSKYAGGAPQNQLKNRIDVSDYMANNVETVAAENVASTQFKSLVHPNGKLDVTDDKRTVSLAESAIDEMSGGTVIDAETFTLTTGTDDLKGTDKDDLFKAVNSSVVSEGTLQVADKIDGLAGNDTLRVDMKQNFTGLTSGSIKNVENVELINSSNANLEFAASKIEGATKYVVTDAVDKNTTISDVASLANIEISGTADTADTTLKVIYNAASTVATGSQTDVQNLKVTNQGSINTAAANVASNAKVMNVDIDKVETLAITTAGTANSLDLSQSADVKTVTVAGEGQTEIKAVGAATTSFDASASTGKVIANLSNAASNSLTTVKGGSSDDSLTVVADDLTASATIAGGAGNDKLIIGAGAGKTLQLGMTGVETLEVGAITSALTFSGTNVSDLTTLKVEGLAAAVSLVNSKATDLTVNSVGANAAAGAISTDNAAKVTYNMDQTAANLAANTQATHSGNATFSNATNLTVNVNKAAVYNTGTITAANATDVKLNIDTKVVAGTEQTTFGTTAPGAAGTLTVAKAKTITVDSKGQLANAAINAAEATTATITAGSTAVAADVLALNAAKLTTLNITAKQDFDLTGSTLTKVQNMTVDTTKAFTMGAGAALVNLDDAANVTVSGTASTSKATFGTLGDTTGKQTHVMNLTATGLKAGLATGDINAGTSSSTINISGVTGNVTLGDITANGGVTLTATNLGGTLAHATGGQVIDIKTTTGKIDVDVSNAAAAVTLGTLTTDGTTGDVTVNASSAIGAVKTGVITGNNVTINGQGALNGVLVNNGADVGLTADVFAKTSVTYTGTNITDNGINIETLADSTAFTATLNGGAKDEKITIKGNSKQTGITVTGNLGAGANSVTVDMLANTASTDTTTAQTVNLSGVTGSSKSLTTTNTTLLDTDSNITYTGSAVKDTITLVASNAKTISITDSVTDTVAGEKDALFISGATGAVTYTNLSVSGIEELTVNTNAASVNASAFSGKAIDATLSTVLTLTGTAGNDVIDLSKFSHGTAGATNLIINADDGNDTIIGLKTGGGTYNGDAGDDTITVSQGINTIAGGAGKDTITLGTGADTVTLATSATEFDTVHKFTIGVADTIGITTATAAGLTTRTDFAAAITKSNGITIESFANNAKGLVTLYDSNTATGTATELYANSVADMIAIATALTGDASVANEALIFKVDIDSNGVAEGSFIVAEHAGGLEMVYLADVTAVGLNSVATAGDITIA